MEWEKCFAPPHDYCGKAEELVSGKTNLKKRHWRNLECTVAGTKFANVPDSVIEKLEPGVALYLTREPQNEYDDNAIAVYFPKNEDGRGVRIGYIPKAKNTELAADMDSGKLPIVTVQSVTTKYSAPSIHIMVSWTVEDSRY